MAAKPLPSRKLVRQRLDYDPETGVFIWRWRPQQKAWNVRFARKPAGTRSHHTNIIIDYVGYRAHRLAWLLVYGEPVPDEIDHIDGNPYNNQISNLRAATSSENKFNCKKYSTNTTGVKGVTFFRDRFVAQINYKGRHHTLGYFHTLEEAAEAVQRERERLHGEFARHQ